MATMMEAIVSSFTLVAASEMGDKTQLLAFSLAAKFKRPLPILCGIFIATLLNHWLSAMVGATVSNYLGETALAWILAAVFIGCGLWALIPDKLEEEETTSTAHGAFLTTAFVFFLAEMGDKTQLATVALAARFQATMAVTFGTTLGMMLTNSLAVFLGDRLAAKVQMKYIRWVASGLFILFGIASAAQALGYGLQG